MTSQSTRQPAAQSSQLQCAVSDADGWMGSEYDQGLVSVIIPTYNRGPLLIHALESVRRQSYRPVEVIVVDDGSTDDTRERVQSWSIDASSQDLKVWYVRKAKGGAPSARNEALRRARGEFVQFLDSDDSLGIAKLVAQLRVLRERPEVDYIWSRSVQSRTYVDLAGQNTDLAPRTLRGRKRVSAPMQVVHGLYRRSICRATGPWNERLTRYQDWEYNIRALSLCRAVAFLDIVGYVVHVHDGDRISHTEPHVYADQIVAAYRELTGREYPYLDRYLKRYMCSQALVSASFLYLSCGATESGKEIARMASREAPVFVQKLRALGYEMAVHVVPEAIARVLARRAILAVPLRSAIG